MPNKKIFYPPSVVLILYNIYMPSCCILRYKWHQWVLNILPHMILNDVNLHKKSSNNKFSCI